MKYRNVVHREGELLGPVDWSYDFRQHFNNYGCPELVKDKMCAQKVTLLRQIADDPTAWRVCINDYWHPLYAVGMYDGWPFWKPTPALQTGGVLGAEWHFFYDLDAAKRLTPEATA